VAISAAYLFLGLLILFFGPQINLSFGFISRYTYIVGAAATLSGVGGLLLAYLRGDLGFASGSDDSEYRYLPEEAANQISKELKDLRKQITEARAKPQLESEDKAALRADLKSEIKDILASDIVSQIQQKYAKQIADDTQISQIRTSFETTLSRLWKEVGVLTRKSNVNLVIGILTTVVAVGLLAYLVLKSPTVPLINMADVLSHFIPRVSVAVFIEVFSFFFLKLYKSNLDEIKYFQNELTNVEMKVIALESAFLADKNKSSDTIIEQLVRTDRNSKTLSTTTNSLSVEPQDIADLLDKIGKILNVGAHK